MIKSAHSGLKNQEVHNQSAEILAKKAITDRI